MNWCMSCRTALAEAEVEYENHASPSIWVRFALTSAPEKIDAAIVQSDHVEYRTIGPDDLPGIRTLVDGRNIVENPDKFTAGNVAWSILGRRTEPRSAS